MRRNGSVNIIVLLFFLISLVLGALSGIYKALNSPRDIRPEEERQDLIAVPVPQPAVPKVSLPGRAEPEKIKIKTYVIKGVGERGVVTVDLPDRSPISVDKPDKKSEITVKLPPQLENIISDAKSHIDAFDEATRQTVQAVIESLNLDGVVPDKATIRPSGGGIQLNISIPIGED